MYIKTVHNRNSNVNYLFFKKYNFEARPYHRIETALVTFGLNRLKRPILSGSRYFQIDSERQTVTKEDGPRLTVTYNLSDLIKCLNYTLTHTTFNKLLSLRLQSRRSLLKTAHRVA